VCCDGAKGDMMNISHGVPQGSILGPTLFIIYINDIFTLRINGHVQLYADDTALVYSEKDFSSLQRKMTMDLQTLLPWLERRNLLLNFDKTKFILFKRKNMNLANIFHTITINNRIICSVSEYDFLGLRIDENINWSPHISMLCSRISPTVGLLKKIRYSLNYSSLKMIYFAFIHTKLTYLLPIWCTAPATYINCLKYLQNKAIKHIKYLPYDSPTAQLYSEEFLSLSQQSDFDSILLIHKMKTKVMKCNFPIITNYEITGRNTRSSSLLRQPNYLSVVAQKSIFFKGLLLFNSLPDNIKNAQPISSFKRNLLSYIRVPND
jgi:hypothetical protein